jgi:hypothetical protein
VQKLMVLQPAAGLLVNPLAVGPCRNPVFLTLCHMMACAALGYTLSVGAFTPIKPLKSAKQLAKVGMCPVGGLQDTMQQW